ncbi:MAG: hypothetical protein ISS74_06400, partial [Planctomycetes bacterium]|nr:hypothetical protein [Planctomycetota bacterium]
MTASPPVRTCTLDAHLRVEPGTMADWHAMAPLHYRSHHAGAVTNVFRLVYAPTAQAPSRVREHAGTPDAQRAPSAPNTSRDRKVAGTPDAQRAPSAPNTSRDRKVAGTPDAQRAPSAPNTSRV